MRKKQIRKKFEKSYVLLFILVTRDTSHLERSLVNSSCPPNTVQIINNYNITKKEEQEKENNIYERE